MVSSYVLAGKVIVYPTDTVYGLGCLATDDEAVTRVYRIKKREFDKPLLVLASDMEMVERFFWVTPGQRGVLNRYWPGPYSFILEEKGKLSPVLTGGKGTAGVRLPKNEFLIKMIDRVKAPVVSTSLNVSGREVLDRVDDLEREFGRRRPDIILNAGGMKQGKPSTLMDLTDPGDINILRG